MMLKSDGSRTPESSRKSRAKSRSKSPLGKEEETKDHESNLDAARISMKNANLDSENNTHLDAFCFNQDASCIAIGTSSGFRVFMSNPLKCQFERSGMQSIKIAELLFRNQIVALVSKQDNNKVMIWDDYQLRQIDEIKVG